MKRTTKAILNIFIILIVGLCNTFGQVELSKETSEKEKKEKKIYTEEEATAVFFTANWSNTNRKLIENDGLFGDSLGLRANETGMDTWSFALGIRNRLHKNFLWEGGIAYMKNGEVYSYKEVDSTFSYETTYSYISMPIRGLFTFGNRIQLQIGGGIVPQMRVGYKRENKWSTTLGGAQKETIKVSKDKINSVVFSTVLNVGTEIKLGRKMSLIIMPEYKIQLSSSFMKNSKYKHFARSLGVNFGFVVQL